METSLTQALAPRKLLQYIPDCGHEALSAGDIKKTLRKIFKDRRRSAQKMSSPETWGNLQTQRVLSFLEEHNTPCNIASYLPMGSEWNPNHCKTDRWVFPKTHTDRSLLWFAIGSSEPHSLMRSRLDVLEKGFDECFEFSEILGPVIMFVPCLAADKNGYRLGYGGGYYDTHLAKYAHKIVSVCVLTNDFFFEELPHESHDVSVDIIATENSLYFTRPYSQVLCKLRT